VIVLSLFVQIPISVPTLFKFLHSFFPFSKYISPFFPLYKFLLSFSPFVKSLFLFSPFTKGGLRGISRNLPQPSFCKGRRPKVGGGF